jgi:hypothetical protein
MSTNRNDFITYKQQILSHKPCIFKHKNRPRFTVKKMVNRCFVSLQGKWNQKRNVFGICHPFTKIQITKYTFYLTLFYHNNKRTAH